MEYGATEIQAVQEIALQNEQDQIAELSALQLLLVGGGVGEVIFG